MNEYDVKKINLGPNDILWLKMADDTSMQTMAATAKTVKHLLDSMGKDNRVLVTKNDCDFQIVGIDSLPAAEALARGGQAAIYDTAKCDCGGEKTGGGHADYCSTQRRSP